MITAVASWAIALAVMTGFGIAIGVLFDVTHVNLLTASPKPFLVLIGISGVCGTWLRKLLKRLLYFEREITFERHMIATHQISKLTTSF